MRGDPAQLVLRYLSTKGESYGRLVVTFKSETFCGESSIWVSPAYVKDNFVAALREYPLSPDLFPLLDGGYSVGDGSNELAQKHVLISIKPYDALGWLLVHVQLATSFQSNPDQDRQHTLTARFLTEYVGLPQFATDIDHILEKKQGTAMLCGFGSPHRF